MTLGWQRQPPIPITVQYTQRQTDVIPHTPPTTTISMQAVGDACGSSSRCSCTYRMKGADTVSSNPIQSNRRLPGVSSAPVELCPDHGSQPRCEPRNASGELQDTWLSVTRPSSSSCSRMFITSGCAFSASSNRMTLWGCRLQNSTPTSFSRQSLHNWTTDLQWRHNSAMPTLSAAHPRLCAGGHFSVDHEPLYQSARYQDCCVDLRCQN